MSAQNRQRADIQSRRHPEEGEAHPRKQKGEGRFLGGGIFLLLFFLSSLFYVWTRMEVVKSTYELSQLQRQLEVQTQHNEKLTLELLTLKAPDRLVSVAVQKLGMLPPGEGKVKIVK